MHPSSSIQSFSTVSPGMTADGPGKAKSESGFPRAKPTAKNKPPPGFALGPHTHKVIASLPDLDGNLEWQRSLSIFPVCNISDAEPEVDNVLFVDNIPNYQRENALKAVNGNKSSTHGFNNLAPDVVLLRGASSSSDEATSTTVSAENAASLIELKKSLNSSSANDGISELLEKADCIFNAQPERVYILAAVAACPQINNTGNSQIRQYGEPPGVLLAVLYRGNTNASLHPSHTLYVTSPLGEVALSYIVDCTDSQSLGCRQNCIWTVSSHYYTVREVLKPANVVSSKPIVALCQDTSGNDCVLKGAPWVPEEQMYASMKNMIDHEIQVLRALTDDGNSRMNHLPDLKIWWQGCEEAPAFVISSVGSPVQMTQMLPETIPRLVYQVLLALDWIHQKGFVHCDVQPDNILQDAEETFKLIDFGVACGPRKKIQEPTGTSCFSSFRVNTAVVWQSSERRLVFKYRDDIESTFFMALFGYTGQRASNNWREAKDWKENVLIKSTKASNIQRMRDNKQMDQCSDAETQCCNMLYNFCGTVMSCEDMENRKERLEQLEYGEDSLPECTAHDAFQALGFT